MHGEKLELVIAVGFKTEVQKQTLFLGQFRVCFQLVMQV